MLAAAAALDVSAAAPTAARKRALKGPRKAAAGEAPGVVLGRRKDVGKAGRKAATAAIEDTEDAEEGLLEEAIWERSINKYFAADPLWTGQLAASGLAWALVVSTS